MPPAGFDPAIPSSEWLHTYALDRTATKIGSDFTSYLHTCAHSPILQTQNRWVHFLSSELKLVNNSYVSYVLYY